MKRALAVVLARTLAGCGCPAADLFVVQRSGADRNANLTLLVSDDGTVTCNGGKHPISGDLLLRRPRARAPDLSEQAELNLVLPPGPNPCSPTACGCRRDARASPTRRARFRRVHPAHRVHQGRRPRRVCGSAGRAS